jgi:Ca2+-binding EF-hand superfamily protein
VLAQDCFTLIDADGSGAIDVSELWQAFRLLNLRMTKTQVSQLGRQLQPPGRIALRKSSGCLSLPASLV